MRTSLTGLNRKKLRLWLTLFFVALAIPTAILIYQAYSQLKWEAYHQHQLLAEEVAARIDEGLIRLILDEEKRSFSDYAFLVVAGDPSASFVQRSSLSAYPLDSPIPGLVGYFQVDTDGRFSTPLLPQPGVEPADYGISPTELEQRLAYAERIRQILSDNRLVKGGYDKVPGRKGSLAAGRPGDDRRRDQAREIQDMDAAEDEGGAGLASMVGQILSPADTGKAAAEQEVMAQAAFDRLNAPAEPRDQAKKQKTTGGLGRVEDLKLDYSYQAAAPQSEAPQARFVFPEKRARKERAVLPEPPASLSEARRAPEAAAKKAELNISIFESEIDPFEFSLLDSGHLVLFRKVWRDGQRYIQGLLIDQDRFLRGTVELMFRGTALAQMSDLAVAYQGEVLSAFTEQVPWGYLHSAEDLEGALLYQTRLSAPLSDLEMIFSVTRLPSGPGASLITWVAAILALVLCSGFYLMYRLGAKQIDLARQQQDFVSAVSHELKTPLTSIRMYGEMLREGWASDEKKKTYYDYIFDESERLSRLIGNVLQLARMTRNDLQVNLEVMSVAELLGRIRSRIAAHIERAGFALNLDCPDEARAASIRIDADYFTQIVINLVDNAIKFSAKAERKVIDIGCRLQHGGTLLFTVRDYGPGVPADQMKKIFKLFYRSENELTRETVGTGIGLALVHQLALSMHGQVDVINTEPGAEFRVSFPAADGGTIADPEQQPVRGQ